MAVLVPCDDMVKTDFCFALVSMVQYTLLSQPKNLGKLSVQPYSTSILPYSRQRLAEAALDQGATHTLWIDSDMLFPVDTITRFLERDDPIIGINATSRRPPFRNTAQIRPRVNMETTAESTGIVEVHRMGFGVLWVACEVYKALEKPWFDFEYIPEMGCWRGEDYYFLEKAREAGFTKMLVDQDLSKHVFHVGNFGFNPLLVKLAAGEHEAHPDEPEPASPQTEQIRLAGGRMGE